MLSGRRYKDLSRSCLQYYKGRFQIDFLFSNAKQFTGLTHSQARSESKLHFHFDTMIKAVFIAKVIYESGLKRFFIAKLCVIKIFSNSDSDMSCKKINQVYRDAL